jgi:heptosyltransferase-3
MTAVLSPSHPLPPSALAEAGRILVVKLDGVGDFVLATPFLRGLRAAAPHAHISLVVLPGVVPLTVGCPHVDAVVTPLGDLWAGTMTFRGRTSDDLPAFAAAFRAGFDLCVVPRFDIDNKGATPLVSASRARLRVGFSTAVTPWKAAANAGFDDAYTHVLTDATPRHEMAHNAALLRALGGGDPGEGTELYLSDAERRLGAARLAAAFGGVRPRLVVGVVATSGGLRKDYPVRQLAPLLTAVAADLRVGLAILGAPGDGGVAAELQRQIKGAQAAVLPPTDSVSDSAAVIAACDGAIMVDTGPAHIAAGAGLPLVVVCCHPADGSDAAPFSPIRYRPVGQRVLVLQPPHAQPPCTDMCTADRAHCIIGIDATAAAARTAAFLAPLMSDAGHE